MADRISRKVVKPSLTYLWTFWETMKDSLTTLERNLLS